MTLNGSGAHDFDLGFSHGYHTGRCEAVLRQLPQEQAGILFNKKVLYISSGLDMPYSPLDHVIIQELQGLVAQLVAVTPSDKVVERALTMRPDLVLVLNGSIFFPVKHMDTIRSSGIKTAIWLTDDPYYTDLTIHVAPRYDYVFTLELSCVPLYKGLGCKQVHYMPLAFNPVIFRPKYVEPSYRSDICFIGNAFRNRVVYFDRIAKYLSSRKVIICGSWWNRLRHYRILRSKIRPGWQSPEQTAGYYNGARIVINLHRSHDDRSYNRNSRKIPALSVNPRTFEIAGCGSFQLTDLRPDLNSCFIPGSEIATFYSPEDLIDKIEYYLNHEEERREIALKGLAVAMRRHSYRKRIAELLRIVWP